MPVKLATNRPDVTSLDDAKRVFCRLANASIQIARIRAQAEARIATIKRETQEREADHAASVAECEELLRGFILAHPAAFTKPRQVKTEWGAFGLRTLPPDVVVSDEAALIAAALDLGYDDIIKTVRSPVKPAIKARLESGEKLPGVTLREGYEEASYTVAKHLIAEAKEATP